VPPSSKRDAPYYYSTYETEDEGPAAPAPAPNTVVVLGSGPIRIGQGIEFDYCSVHAADGTSPAGCGRGDGQQQPGDGEHRFRLHTRLYFEPLDEEAVSAIIEEEQASGVVGAVRWPDRGQPREPLDRAGFTILGSSIASIDLAEDRRASKR